MPRRRARLAIEIDEWVEAAGFAADDGDHQRKAERAGAGERRGRAADAQPDGQGILHGSGVDALAGECGSMFAGPGYVLVVSDLEEQVELLGEERVVVLELEAE